MRPVTDIVRQEAPFEVISEYTRLVISRLLLKSLLNESTRVKKISCCWVQPVQVNRLLPHG